MGIALVNQKGSALSFQQLDELAKVLAVVVEGAPAYQVAVDHAGLVDEGASADLEVELALGHRGHATSADAVGPGRNLHAMAYTGHGEIVVEEILGDADEVEILPDVFRGPSPGEKDSGILGLDDFTEGDLGLDGITLPFLGDGPARLHLVHDHLVGLFSGPATTGSYATLPGDGRKGRGCRGFPMRPPR